MNLYSFLAAYWPLKSKSAVELPTVSHPAKMSDLNPSKEVDQEEGAQINADKEAITSIRSVLKTLQALGFALLAGLACNYLKIPVAWLIGPLVAGVTLAFMQGRARPLPTIFRTLGKAIIGIYSASRFSVDTLNLAQDYLFPLMLCILVTASLSMLNGLVLWKWAGVDRTTSFLGAIPGSASNIVAMSEDLGANSVSVAVLQYTRMMLVALLVPTAASWLATANDMEMHTSVTTVVSQSEQVFAQPLAICLLFVVGCCYLGPLLGRRLRLPAPAFLGSFFLGLAVFWLFPNQFYVPNFAFLAALLMVGLAVGLKFDWQTIRTLWRAVLIEIGLIILLMLGCLGIGYEFHLVTHVDIMTALLGFVPGAIEAMVATAHELGGDTGIVLAIQMTRQFLILLVLAALNIAVSNQSASPEVKETIPLPKNKS